VHRSPHSDLTTAGHQERM